MKKYRILTVLFSIVSIAIISSCTSSYYPQAKPLPEITFEHMDKVSLLVSKIDYKDYSDSSSVSSFSEPKEALVASREYNLAKKIKDHMAEYVSSRFSTDGDRGELRILLQELNVDKKFIESDSKLKRYLDIGKIEKIDVTMKIVLQHVDDWGRELKGSVLTIRRYSSFDASLSLVEREREMFAILDNLMRDMDKAVVNSVTNSLKISMNDMKMNSDIEHNFINEQAHKDTVRIVP